MSSNRLPVRIGCLLFHANERQNPGFEFTANRILAIVRIAQIHQHLASVLCLSPFQHAQSQLSEIFCLALRIDLNQLFNYFFVIPVVVANLIDPSFLLQLLNHILSRLTHVFFGNLSSSNRIVDTAVNADKQTCLAGVSRSIGQFFFDLDRNVSKRPKSAGHRHQTVFDVPTSWDRRDFAPKCQPLLESLLLVSNFAVEPRQPHLKVFGNNLPRSADRFIDLNGLILSSNPLIRTGKLGTNLITNIIESLHAVE